MIEKSGTIQLTIEDLNEFHKGLVSQRVKDTWNLSLQELQEVIQNHSYTLHITSIT